MFAQHNNDSNLVIDSRDSLDHCKILFWLNRSSFLAMIEVEPVKKKKIFNIIEK